MHELAQRTLEDLAEMYERQAAEQEEMIEFCAAKIVRCGENLVQAETMALELAPLLAGVQADGAVAGLRQRLAASQRQAVEAQEEIAEAEAELEQRRASIAYRREAAAELRALLVPEVPV